METKQCTKCSEVKAVSEFYKRGDGLRADCKTCVQQRAKVSHAKNRAARLEKMKSSYEESKAERLAYQAKYKQENLDQVRAANRYRYKNNKPAFLASNNKRRAAKLQRTPPWADMSAIAEFYVEAKRLEELTGIQFHVDHIVPLQGELVSGLHVPANLQLLPAHENLSKSNSFEVAA